MADIFEIVGRVSLDGIDRAERELNNFTNTGERSSSRLSKFGSIAKAVGKGILVGTGAVVTGAVGLVKQVSSSYGALQQSIGGIETLFGKSAQKVIDNANNAYKTAGMSANDYMQQVTSFSASLLQSLGDVFENCIFRESLDIKPEDLESLKDFIGSKEAFQSIFKVDLQIDSFKAVLDSVTVYNQGIVCAFRSGHNTAAAEHTIRIIFHMPKVWDSLIEVALVDPVKAPKISVSYPEDIMDVDMYSFLSKGKESSLEVAHEHFNGIYDIAITSEWIYPISGMVFKVNRK